MTRSYLINNEQYYYALTTDSGLVKVLTNRISLICFSDKNTSISLGL